jgi:hypothetical protein
MPGKVPGQGKLSRQAVKTSCQVWQSAQRSSEPVRRDMGPCGDDRSTAACATPASASGLVRRRATPDNAKDLAARNAARLLKDKDAATCRIDQNVLLSTPIFRRAHDGQ